jgi:hypothetical protein
MSYILDGDVSSKNKRVKQKFYSSDKNVLFLILNYDNMGLSYDDYNTSKYRSVIFAYPEKTLLCYSPPKSLPTNIFMKMYPKISAPVMTIFEAIDGVMINLFFDKRTDKWEISTKNAIGGRYWFYGSDTSKTTFYRMFLDAFRSNSGEDINDIEFIKNLPKTASYTFILQHSENQILLPVQRPRVVLVGVYHISQNYADYVPSFIYENWDIFKIANNPIEFPCRYDPQTYDELFKMLSTSECGGIKYGFIVKNEFTGDMMKIVTPDYENLKISLSIRPMLQYQFLCLNRIDKVQEYLKETRTKKNKMMDIRRVHDGFIYNVHRLYMDYYVRKIIDTVPEKYFTHIYKIHHDVYLPSIKMGIRKNITFKEISNYFKGIDPKEFMYILNEDRREITETVKDVC